MANLKTDDGETVLDGLTAPEISKLRAMGVDVDFDSDDTDEDRDGESPTPSDDDPDSDATSDSRPDDDGPSGESDDSVDGDYGSTETTDGDPADDDGRSKSDTGSRKRGVGDGKIDPDEAGREFADRDRESIIEENFDVDLDSVREPDERERARWTNLVKQLSEYGQNIPRRKRERDERRPPTRIAGSKVRTELKTEGVISDLKDGFQKLVSRPTPRPARNGPQMDMNNVVRRASGDISVRRLFEENVQVETGDRCIGLATDISGSMGSDMVELKKAGAAIAEATEIVGDSFVWEAFTDEGHGGLDLRIVTGPQESFRYEHLDSFTSGANEPTGAGIRDCRMLMERTTKHEYTMIVITDGKALVGEDGTFYGSSSNKPVEHAREAVAECRQSGIEVIGLGIGGMDEKKMTETFGDGNYVLTSVDKLADDIINLYESMMDVSRGR